MAMVPPMTIAMDTSLGHYECDGVRYELRAQLDELSLTYHVLQRGPDGRPRRLKAHLSSLWEARRWAEALRSDHACRKRAA